MLPTPEFSDFQPLSRDSYIDHISRDVRLEEAVTAQFLSIGRYIQNTDESFRLDQLNDAIAATKLIQLEICLESNLSYDEVDFMLDLCESRLLMQVSP